jgi:hypothetical protein
MTTNLLRGALDILDLSALILRGGPGSGHFSHAGRPGVRGGSAPSGGQATGENPSNYNPDTGMYKFKLVFARKTNMSKWQLVHVAADQKDLDRVMPGIDRDYLKRAQPWQVQVIDFTVEDINKVPRTIGATEMNSLVSIGGYGKGRRSRADVGLETREPSGIYDIKEPKPRLHRGWTVEKVGGHITIGRYIATAPDGRWFWMERLGDVKKAIDAVEADAANFEKISTIHKKPLYS